MPSFSSRKLSDSSPVRLVYGGGERLFLTTCRRAALAMLLCCLCAGALTGCATSSRKMGDRALQEKRYTEALDLYEQEIAEGSRDPELFYNAAQASLYEGDLGGAERYYSRSIKYGGGIKVMRALAQLYIQTSNYARAAQVLYELLRLDPDRQTIYANLGAALLYSGQPSEAESYLLIAQQLDPGDPTPYINLAVVYDRYLSDPLKSAAFYSCYARLTPPGAPHHSVASTRARELEERSTLLGEESFPLRCGEAYVPGDYRSEERRRAKLEALKQQAQEEDRQLLLLETPSGEEDSEPLHSTRPATSPEPLTTLPSNEDTPTREVISKEELDTLEAKILAVSREMRECESILAEPTLEKSGALTMLSASSLQVVASCHQALQQPQKAEKVWLMVLQKKPSALALGSLLQLMDVASRKDEIRSLCEEYAPHVETLSSVQKCQEAR